MNPSTLEVCNAILEAGLLTESELKHARSESQSSDADDSKDFIELLVRKQQITRWQAKFLAQGKANQISLGNYLLLDKLGQGGMGVVFKARHRTMDRVVAIKTLDPKFFKKTQVVQRFQREVKAAAKLVHPNIISSFDAGEARGCHYLVMEFVEGRDLHAIVTQNGAFDHDRAVELILQVASGLEHAHSTGIVHRDVKPNNLMLSNDGLIKVLDLGLAQFFQNQSNPDEPAAAPLTEAGRMMGTADYMSPEQATDASSADARSDIYSLGCTLFFLCSGRPMFEGKSAINKMMAHQTDPIPSLTEVCGASDSLNRVFRKMVAKKPEDRYPSMSEVIEALKHPKNRKNGLQKSDDSIATEAGSRTQGAKNRKASKPSAAEARAALIAEKDSSSTKNSGRVHGTMSRSSGGMETEQLFAASDTDLPWALNSRKPKPAGNQRSGLSRWLIVGGTAIATIVIAAIVVSSRSDAVGPAPVEINASSTDESDENGWGNNGQPKSIRAERVISL